MRRRSTDEELTEKALWQRCIAADAAVAEPAYLLDLASFADGTLDADDQERVADWLARDAASAADVAAARAQSTAPTAYAPPPESVVTRAVALVGGRQQAGQIIAFPAGRRARSRLPGMVQWGSLAAAVAVAGWLGLTLGITTSQAFVVSERPAAGSFFSELLDTQAPLFGAPGEASRS